MEKTRTKQLDISRFENRMGRMSVNVLTVLVVVGLYLGIVFFSNSVLRESIREQILSRDATILFPMTKLETERLAEDLSISPSELHESDFLAVALQASKLAGVEGIRLYDSLGQLIASVPDSFISGTIDEEEFVILQSNQPVSRFYLHGNIDSPDLHEEAGKIASETEAYALLEVTIPVFTDGDSVPVVFVQYVLNGKGIAQEFELLDTRFLLYTSLAGGIGGLIIVVILTWSFSRLQRANRGLKKQQEKLAAANRELLLKAKTSALGALTAHLMHDLKSPLTGLRDFVENRDVQANGQYEEEDWALAVSATRRMQVAIQQVSELLQDDHDGALFNFDLNDIFFLLRQKLESAGKMERVTIVAEANGKSVGFDNRSGNIILLVLQNLIQNACDAIDESGTVTLKYRMTGNESNKSGFHEFFIIDSGAGIPGFVRERLFKPVRSQKPGGSGIGLVISNLLSREIDASLELITSSSSGTTFCLKVPIVASPVVENSG